jgi:tryptophanyl-tRNA synthetase
VNGFGSLVSPSEFPVVNPPSSRSQETVLSGFKPTGLLQLGNYLGAVKNCVALQDQYHCFYSIVDYHAMTIDHNPQELRRNTMEMAFDLLACGIDPQRSVFFVQSQVPEHTELAWILSCVTSYGDLQRMTQFKEKGEEQEFVSCGLFTYPVLQAADILIYKASKIPVGEDQVQHIELTRRIARRFNQRFGDLFPEPDPIVGEALRIKSLADPERKMSKSYGDKHTITLTEPESEILKKVKSAVTDTGPQSQEKSPGVANLFLLLKLMGDAKLYQELESAYTAGTLQYSKLKMAVYDVMMAELKPIRERRAQLDETGVRKILKAGAEKARDVAQKTLAEARDQIGVGPLVSNTDWQC